MSDVKKIGEVSEAIRDIEAIKNVNENLERELQQQGLSPEQISDKVDQIKATVGGELNKAAQVVKDGVSFAGTYKYHMDKVEEHGKKSRALEREANDLEKYIRRGKKSDSRKGEVDKLRKEAEEEKKLEQMHKGLAQQALQQSHKEPSFEGSCRDKCLKCVVLTINVA